MVIEHRASAERRQRDIGPPTGCIERRQLAERRLPVAEEATLSDDDFMKYFGASIVGINSFQLDQAAEVFDRVRDGY